MRRALQTQIPRNVAQILAVLATLGPLASLALADAKSKAAREAAEYVLKKFGKEAGEEGVEVLGKRIEGLAARHGDGVLDAVRRVGPRAAGVIEEAGAEGAVAARLMARFGDDAVWVASQPRSLALFGKYGDDAAEAMIKHRGVAEPVLEAYAEPAAAALKTIGAQNGRRLAMMTQEGELAKIGRTGELLQVVSRQGDRAMDFIWRHKGALAVTAALAAFLAEPEPFIDGTRDITMAGFEAAAKPLAEVTGRVADQAARSTNWTLVALAAILLGCCYFAFKSWMRHRSRLSA